MLRRLLRLCQGILLFALVSSGHADDADAPMAPFPGAVYKLREGGVVREFVVTPKVLDDSQSVTERNATVSALRKYYPTLTESEAFGAAMLQVTLPQDSNLTAAQQRTLFVRSIREAGSKSIHIGLRGRYAASESEFARLASTQLVAKVGSAAEAAKLALQTGAIKSSFVVKAVPQTGVAPGEFWVLEYATAADALEAAETLAVQGADAELDFKRAAGERLVPNDPLYPPVGGTEPGQWNFNSPDGIDIETAWDSVLGTGVVAAVIDNGTQLDHPDLQPNARLDLSKDLSGNNGNNPAPALGDTHGTATAGLVAARGNNGIFMSGAAPRAGIAAVRLFSGSQFGELVTDQRVATALSWNNQSIDVYNNSWGFTNPGEWMTPAGPLASNALKDDATNGRGGRGNIVVWAAGNDWLIGDMANWDGLANSRFVTTVGALSSQGERSPYSETGANLLVCAPSNSTANQPGITSIVPPNSSTNAFGGTSAAAPQVAGVAALMLEANPYLTYRDMKEIMIKTADVVDPAAGLPNDLLWLRWQTNSAGYHFNNQYGAGKINATAAVAAAKTWIPLLPETVQSQIKLNPGVVPDNDPTGLIIPFTFNKGRAGTIEVSVSLSMKQGYRQDTQIVLISPSGMRSYLTEKNFIADKTGNDIDWTFSTVQHWGESTAGLWRVFMVDTIGVDNATVHSVGVKIFTAPKDLPPTVSITRPANGEIIIAGAYAGNVTAAAADDRHVSRVQFFVDGTLLAVDTAPPYEASLAKVPAGVHTLYAIATDNYKQSTKSKTVTVDIREPAYLTVNLGPAAAIEWGARWFLGSSGKAQSTGKTLVVPSGTDQRISFTEALGFSTPPKQTYNLAPFARVTANATYLRPGGLAIAVQPFIMNPMPKWRINGGKWIVSSQTLQGVRPGSYSIQFSDVKGYKTPAARTIIVQPTKFAKVLAKYAKIPSGGGGGGKPAAPEKGVLQVNINPFTVPFKWSLLGSSKVYASGQSIQLKPGSYTVTFVSKSGFETPAPQTVAIKNKKSTLVKVTCQPK
jgi:subtilisin family serine protease